MPPASEILCLSDTLWLWQMYDPAVKSDFFTSAVKTGARLFRIDAVPLAPPCLEELAVPIGVTSVHGFALLPAKYCSDQKAMRRSLGRLQEWPFERLLFAHGMPILTAARKQLKTALR